MNIGDIVRSTDIHSDLYLRTEEIIGFNKKKVVVMFESKVNIKDKILNECVVDMIHRKKLKLVSRKRGIA